MAHPGARAPLRALIVEDDQCLRPILVSAILKIDPRAIIDWRGDVDEVAHEIQENWHRLREYHLVVTDIFLPGLRSGLDLWRACRFSCPRVAFVLTSASSPHVWRRSLPAEIETPPFLPKPFDPELLIELIHGLLEPH